MLAIQTRIRMKIMRKMIGNTEDKILLDIGAGYRSISEGLKTKKTIKLDGVKKYNPDICCDINKGLPLKKESVDVIIAGEIIEHVYNPIKFLRECRRVLKKRGKIVLSVPNLCSLKNRVKVLFGRLPEGCAEPVELEGFERHIIDFCYNRLKKILEKEGFEIIKKKSNGIIFHSKLIFPLFLTPAGFGETLIIKAVKI